MFLTNILGACYTRVRVNGECGLYMHASYTSNNENLTLKIVNFRHFGLFQA